MVQDEVVVSPPHRFEPIVNNNSWSLEPAGAARRVRQADGSWKSEVVGLWMHVPAAGDFTDVVFLRAWSDDGGTTWTLDDLHGPNDDLSDSEFDPFAAYDPVSEALFVGGMHKGNTDFIVRRERLGSVFTSPPTVIFSGANGGPAHVPQVGAGLKRGTQDGTRIYAHFGAGLKWSDDLGDSWQPASPLQTIAGLGLPRVGDSGELYLSNAGATAMKLQRSLVLDANGAPEFELSETTVATLNDDWGADSWFPGNISPIQMCHIATAPHDGTRVYAVWADKTSEQGLQVNVGLYFTMTTDATATTVTWDSDPSDGDVDAPRIIPAGAELAGDQWHPWLAATTYRDSQGATKTRLHLVFLDTRHNPDQFDVEPSSTAFLDVYYAYPTTRARRGANPGSRRLRWTSARRLSSPVRLPRRSSLETTWAWRHSASGHTRCTPLRLPSIWVRERRMDSPSTTWRWSSSATSPRTRP